MSGEIRYFAFRSSFLKIPPRCLAFTRFPFSLITWRPYPSHAQTQDDERQQGVAEGFIHAQVGQYDSLKEF